MGNCTASYWFRWEQNKSSTTGENKRAVCFIRLNWPYKPCWLSWETPLLFYFPQQWSFCYLTTWTRMFCALKLAAQLKSYWCRTGECKRAVWFPQWTSRVYAFKLAVQRKPCWFNWETTLAFYFPQLWSFCSLPNWTRKVYVFKLVVYPKPSVLYWFSWEDDKSLVLLSIKPVRCMHLNWLYSQNLTGLVGKPLWPFTFPSCGATDTQGRPRSRSSSLWEVRGWV